MSIFNFWKGRGRKPQALSPDEHRFALGTRSIADLIAPGAVKLDHTYIRLDNEYARTLVVTGYPRTVSPGWLSPLLNFDEPITISIHMEPLDSGQMVSTLTHKLVQFHSSRLLAARDGRLADPERETAYADTERLRDEVQRGEEKVFSVSLYILVRAKSLAQLDERTRRIEILLASMLIQSRVAIFEQDSGFRSCLPEGQDRLLVSRNFDTTSLALMMPFPAPSLTMKHGVLYGIARYNQAPVIIDPFDSSLENANTVIFAKSGAGKSYFTKLMALRHMYNGVNFLIIDPEDEYRTLCDAVGEDGQHIRLAGSSGQHINPFDLPPKSVRDDTEGRDPLSEQVAALLGLLDIMLSDHGKTLTSTERAMLDRTIYQTYAQAGITREIATHSRAAPLLHDLYATLDGMGDRLAGSLALRLERYVKTSLAGLFAGQTNVALDRSLVVFNVQALEPELRPVGIHLITNFIWNQVRRKRQPRLLIVDEAWSLMQYAAGGAFLASMARRARKYYLGLITVTQDIADFLDAEHGRAILANSSIKLLMKQDSSTADRLEEVLHLSPEERQFLLSASKGEGLFFALGSRVAIKVEACPQENQLATTSPRELEELERSSAEPSLASSVA